jgi:hypothetical protein
MNRKDKELQKELSRSYDIQRNGTLPEKINEAYKNLKFDLDSLYTALENEAIGDTEYYQNKIESYECFVDFVMKAAKKAEED